MDTNTVGETYNVPTTMNPAIACLAGMTAQEAGQMDLAVGHFQHALTLAPVLIDVRLLLAFALGAHGRKSAAQEILNETPDVATLPQSDLRRLADAAVQLDATAVALRTVRLLAEKTSDDADVQSMLGTLLQKTAHSKKPDTYCTALFCVGPVTCPR